MSKCYCETCGNYRCHNVGEPILYIGCPNYKEKEEARMPEGMSLMDYILGIKEGSKLTKEEFGRIMHDPNSTQEEIDRALQTLQDCDGYENLAD